jgi:hypothetical protein
MNKKITERAIFSQIQMLLRTEHILDQYLFLLKICIRSSRKQSANNAARKRKNCTNRLVPVKRAYLSTYSQRHIICKNYKQFASIAFNKRHRKTVEKDMKGMSLRLTK